ncbi:MAG: 23S rRNA (uracil(1939)-C(5))-methyltransferase RlmD [Oscillospiraceae bacterium]|nr:23S rRNA (uracil(1939)-C(5))-methyltransferase RlmD [Oscillospiraceae bacterium]
MELNIPVKKNTVYRTIVKGEGYEGEGVAKIDSYPVFIPDVILNEVIDVLIVKVQKNFGYGKAINIIEESDERVFPICQAFKDCGGCSLMFMSYEHQLGFKRRQVENSLWKTGKFHDVQVLPTIGMNNPFRYRNKIQVPIGKTIGFFSKRTHTIVEVKNCFIQPDEGNIIIDIFKQWINEYDIECYDENTHKGCIRHIVIRKGFNTGEIMVVVVSKSNYILYKDELLQMILNKLPNIKSIYLNINTDRTNVILGEKNILLYGKRTIKEKLFDFYFNISPETFFQINTIQAEVLYKKVLEYADLSKEDVVFDAYCGIGSISLFLAKESKFVYGIEIVEKSVKDASLNAKENNIDNVEFIRGSCGEKINELIDKGISCDCLVLDPPRKGCEDGVIESINRNKPRKIIYVSCNPATLARDLRLICDFGYKIDKVQPVDMFPMTYHVETVSLLTLNMKEN